MNKLTLKEVTIKPFPIVKKMFPEVGEEFELLELNFPQGLYGYICLEYIERICALHLYMEEEHRTEEKIMHLVKGFTDVIHPWIKKRADKVVVNCPYEDIKTMELFKTFGFTPKAAWVGIMEV